MPEYLFAYGTLQPGLAPDAVRSVVDQFRWVGLGSTAGAVYDLGSYPGATFGGAGTIHGTIFELPARAEAAVLIALDAYEGVPDLYERLAVPVMLSGSAGPLTCWAYQYNRDLSGRTAIPSGTYVREPRP